MAARPPTTGRISDRLTRSSGTGESIRIIDPSSRLMMPPALQQPVAGDLDLEHQQGDAEQDEQHAGVVHRKHLQREEGQEQADAAGDARAAPRRGSTARS